MTDASEDVTRLLVQWSGGDREALDRLVPIIYDDLHRTPNASFVANATTIRSSRRRW